jgi:flagellar biogenesis protein FliO
MLGGINNGLFFQGFGGFLVVAIILIPLLIWTFPKFNKDKAHQKELKALSKDLKRLKKK